MGERRGTKALETWCRRVTQGYPGVKVENMTTSWRDGLAFCALIHHFRPDLIDFGRLDKSDVYGNNELAFRIAERHLGIPALLDAEDMAEYPVPDRLSILTYLSQFYQAFASNNSSPVKKVTSDSPDGSLVSLVQGNVQPPPKMEWSVIGREPCAVCNLPVYIAQRLRVGNQLFHRTCFKCARCGAQLSVADYYETCTGQYVCETCPDEMASIEDSEPMPAVRLTPAVTTAASSPAEPPLPTTPPEPPPTPSIVAMRRLMFETDDAKLTKIDHSVNTSRLVHSVKKDLSTKVDTSSPINKNEKEGHVNIDIEQSKDSPSNLEADSSFKDSKSLVECVNSSTIPYSLSHPEDETNINNTKEIILCSNKEEDDDIKLVDKPNLEVSNDTPSFNDNSSSLNLEKLSLHSDSDTIEQRKDVDNVTSTVMPDIVSNEDIVEAVNPEISSPIQTSPKIPPKKPLRSFEYKFKSEVKEDDSKSNVNEYPEDLNPFGDSEDEVKPETKVSTNPFGSDSEDEEDPVETKPPIISPRKLSISMRSTTSTNPFDSDDDDEEATTATPVPLPRKGIDASPEPTPFPRRNKWRTSARSITSLSSIGSYSSVSPRKKKPAPPPPIQGVASPHNLTTSSRYSSMTSIASTRSRKTKRAPLPPSPAKPPLSSVDSEKSVDSPSVSSEISSPGIQIDTTVSVFEESSTVETSKQLLSEIEAGMQELLAKNDDVLPISTKVEKDLINETSRNERAPSIEIEEVKVINLDKQTDIKSADLLTETNINEFDNEDIHKSIPSEHVVKPEVPNVVNEEISFVEQSNDDSIKDIADDVEIVKQEKTDIVEAFNKELSTSVNSLEIKFDNPVHSTPLKVIPALGMFDSSLEDVASGNSVAGSPYLSSPSTSCPDASPYQESLSSPPMEKKHKDSANMHRKISESGVYQPNKSLQGQWKRKKTAPQPPMSIPVRRIVKEMSMDKLKQELSDIEIKQQELERQGVTLEKTIRERFDSESSVSKPVEDLLLQLFELVNEKNELFRKQAELMYIRRQNQLEQEQAELEYQIRCLMARPEENRTDTDKALEETLIGRLIEVVERRDAIVQCLERDRIRESEEDRSINRHLDKFNRAIDDNGTKFKKKHHKKKKDKQNTMTSLDLDKDLDETEKDSKKKKKWFTLHHHKTNKN